MEEDMTNAMLYTRIEDAAEEYLRTPGKGRKLAPSTKKILRIVVAGYAKYVKDTTGFTARIEHFTTPRLQDYFDYRSDLSDGSHHVYYGKLMVIGKWLVEEGWLPTNPMEKVERRNTNRPKRTMVKLSVEDSVEFFRLVEKLDFMTRAAVLFYARTGRRLTEGTHDFPIKNLNLKPSQRWPNGSYTYTEHKRKDKRIVTKPLDPLTREMLEEYLERYRETALYQGLIWKGQKLPEEWPVFPPYKKGLGQKINPFSQHTRLFSKISAIAKEMGIYVEGWSTHALRRWAADYIYWRKGIEAARHLLNHEDARTTRKYLNVDEQDLRLASDLNDIFGGPVPETAPQPEPAVMEGGAQVINLFGRKRTG